MDPIQQRRILLLIFKIKKKIFKLKNLKVRFENKTKKKPFSSSSLLDGSNSTCPSLSLNTKIRLWFLPLCTDSGNNFCSFASKNRTSVKRVSDAFSYCRLSVFSGELGTLARWVGSKKRKNGSRSVDLSNWKIKFK